MNQTVTLGRIVHVFVDKRSNNGADVAPAIITRVWGGGTPNAAPFASVNWRLMLDHSSNDPATQEWRTSVMVFDDQQDAEAYIAGQAQQASDADERAAQLRRAGTVGFFPARV